ncbi:hypothetical protein BJY01DRAFT_229781 [Aspergillus pseudoustus]|uniref:SET domain-containing protein n=1 Tax=Aspergillus pseudoustus TaxID=1810923 RepID=A0ABR4IHN2_9EURO
MHPILDHPIVSKLSELFEDPEFIPRLCSILSSLGSNDKGVCLRIDAVVCASNTWNWNPATWDNHSLSLGWLGFENNRSLTITPRQFASLKPSSLPNQAPPPGYDKGAVTPQSVLNECHRPRHKTVGGLRPSKSSTLVSATEQLDSDTDSGAGSDHLQPSGVKNQPSVRQFHSDARFPQRKRPFKDTGAPALQPSSIDKLISGIWRQVHSPITLSVSFPDRRPQFSLATGVSQEVFRAISGLCKEYYNQNKSSRALEMVVQAHWVECYEARIASILLASPGYTKSEARMMALKEACSTLGWQEKELRNRLAIWRGYKEIKDSGGWASLVFAGTGVYRFCKYRIGFNEGLTNRLRHIASSLEVAADTLHPGWRDLLRIVNQNEKCRYSGHPHEWVTFDTEPALPLANTYSPHQSLLNDFNFKFIDDSLIDQVAFGLEDPRRVPNIDSNICQICKGQQADDGVSNRCSCFPTLFGGVRYPQPVQLYHTTSGKNNGVVARCQFERGTAIAEFVGLVTSGIDGLDVMMGGTPERPYQIFQGHMGNFTRFINHSCRPNSQFQRFYWRGVERVLVVSRGVSAGSEITVDYSESYWRKLKKNCLCGELSCRFAHQVAA